MVAATCHFRARRHTPRRSQQCTCSPAASAAISAWLAGPIGAAASAENLAAIGAAVRLPLVAGPLLAVAAVTMPAAVFDAWPLELLSCYHGWAHVWARAACVGAGPAVAVSALNPLAMHAGQKPTYLAEHDARLLASLPTHPCPCARSASLDERYAMARERLDAGKGVPWSAVRRQKVADEGLASLSAAVWLSQLRSLHTQSVHAGHGDGDSSAEVPAGSGDGSGLLLGAACFGGYRWSVELVCCQLPRALESGDTINGSSSGSNGSSSSGGGTSDGQPQPQGQQQEAPVPGASRAAAPWRLGLRVSACPMLGAFHASGSDGSAPAAAGILDGNRHLLAVGAAKARAALAHHATAAPEGGGCEGEAHEAAFDVAAGVCLAAAEHHEQPLAATGPFWPLALRQSCGAAGGGAWCLRPAAVGRQDGAAGGGCGLCRRGVAEDALAAASAVGAGHGAFEGWEPARWSALAPAGQLRWHCALRLLTDY
jgi:hypothetical protein